MSRLKVNTRKSKNKTMIIRRFTPLLEQARPAEVKDYFAVGGVEGEYEEVKSSK